MTFKTFEYFDHQRLEIISKLKHKKVKSIKICFVDIFERKFSVSGSIQYANEVKSSRACGWLIAGP